MSKIAHLAIVCQTIRNCQLLYDPSHREFPLAVLQELQLPHTFVNTSYCQFGKSSRCIEFEQLFVGSLLLLDF